MVNSFQGQDTCARSRPDIPNVVTSCKKLSLQATTTIDSRPTLTLAEQTLRGLLRFFSGVGHKPSDEILRALSKLANTMQSMANGDCPEGFYLSSLDPGIGKTQTLVHFARALIESDRHGHVGILVCVSRLSEIQALADDLGLAPSAFAAFTANTEINRLSPTAPQDARILLTTQQMIESRCEGKLLADVDVLTYRGQPRQVRVWDESMLPAEPLTVSRYGLAALLDPLSRVDKIAAAVVDRMMTEMHSTLDGRRISVPDLEAVSGVDLNEALRAVREESRGLETIVSTLWKMSGRSATVRQEGQSQNMLLDFHENLPSDLAPIVILDASGRVRNTYRLWERHRGKLVRLSTATKRYEPLTIHVWRTGGGKGSFARSGTKLVDGIASTILTKRNEEWLVVHHKPRRDIDVESRVRGLVGKKATVHFVTWGNHQATNAFAHVPNVILAGTLFYRPAHYEALGRASASMPSSSGPFSTSLTKEIAIGEHCHQILQAICRGAVRRCNGSACLPCDAYIITATGNGIEASLPRIFPGCQVVSWNPVPIALKGRVKEAFDYIKDWFEVSPTCPLPFTEVYKAIGMERANFTRDVRGHTAFQEALARIGVIEWVANKYKTQFVSEFSQYGFEVEEDGYTWQ